MLHYNEFNLYLIRHGQSEVNVLPDHVGQSKDTKLTKEGKVQASLLGCRLFQKEKLSVDRVFSSDYTRAVDTCNIALGNSPIVQSVQTIYAPELREYSAGDWTGSSRKEIYDITTILRMAAMTNSFLPPNGESFHMVERRASKWLEDTILYNEQVQAEANKRQAQNLLPQNIFVFSHGITIKCLLHYIMGFDQSFTWKINLENTSISKLHFDSKG